MLKQCLLVFCLLLLASEAHATTLEITSGGIDNIPFVPIDLSYSFSGPGFSVTGMTLDGGYIAGTSFGTSFVDNGGVFPTVVTIDGFAPCTPTAGFPYSCGQINLTIAPLPPVNDNDFKDYLAVVPFTATGWVDTQPEPFSNRTDCCDIEGHGLLTMRYSDETHPDFFVSDASFAFVAPEPSTLALLSVSILGFPLLRRVKARHFPR
jgi:hypothetical protein